MFDGRLMKGRARLWLRRALVVLAVIVAVVLVAAVGVAYLWQPSAAEGSSAYQARIDSRYVETDVARFHYTRAGSGPPVVLLPGGTLWIYTYRDVIPALAEHNTVYALDPPGHGYTTLRREEFAYDLAAMSGALESFLDAVGLERVSLVGHSWGGAVSAYFAERNDERVDKLALIAAPVLDDPSSWTFRSLEFPVVGELTGKLMGRSMFADTLTGGAFEHGDRITDEDIDEYWLPLSRPGNREAMWKLQRGFDLGQTESRLGDVRSETLILWGDQDQWVEPWQATELDDRIPNSTVRILRGCGHNVHEDCPNRAIPALSGFLRQDEPATDHQR